MAVAALVFLARPDREQNRLLALALFFDGLTWAMLAARVAAESAHVATASLFTQMGMFSLSLFAYLVFLGTLETPLVRPLRRRGARVVAAAAGAAGLGLILLRPTWFYPRPLVSAPPPWQWTPPEVGLGLVTLVIVHMLVLVLALGAALHAWGRTEAGTLARSRAGWYVAAFTVRDTMVLINWGVGVFHVQAGTTPALTWWGSMEMVLLPVSFLVFCALVSYGILKHQLFDIDLRIKWTIRQSTVVAIFIAVFFLVSEAAATFIGERTGSTYLGIAAAAVLLFFIAPLQRLAERISDKAMPNVQDTEEYRSLRAGEIYQAAVESALVDGVVTERERDVLATLADQLGLSAGDARAIERETAAISSRA